MAQREQDRDGRVAERGNDVTQQRHPVEGGGEPAETARSERVGEYSEEQQTACEREGIGELAGEGGGEVPAFDRVGGVEQEGQGCHGHQGRDRPLEVGQTAEGPSGHGQGDGTENGDELEGNGVGEHDRERGHEKGGEREVEDVEREALEPLRVPSSDAALGQQVVDEEVRSHDVTGVVTAYIHARAEEKIGP